MIEIGGDYQEEDHIGEVQACATNQNLSPFLQNFSFGLCGGFGKVEINLYQKKKGNWRCDI